MYPTLSVWRVALFAGGLLSSLLLSLTAAADSTATPAFTPASEPVLADYSMAPPATCPQRQPGTGLMNWADNHQCTLDQKVQTFVHWFDDRYGHSAAPVANPADITPVDARPAEAKPAKKHDDDTPFAFLRIISEAAFDTQGNFTPAFRIDGDVNLPQINHRLSLVLYSETSDLQRQAGLPMTTATNDTTLGLRWLAGRLGGFQISTDAGLGGGLDIYGRIRARRTWTLAEQTFLRFSQSVSYGIRSHSRDINQIELTHVFPTGVRATLYHYFNYQEVTTNPMNPFWLRGLSFSRGMEPYAMITTGYAEEGQARPTWALDSRYIWLRWRHPVLRDWLYLEMEPRLTQSRDSGWDTIPGIILRLEVQIGRPSPRLRELHDEQAKLDAANESTPINDLPLPLMLPVTHGGL